MKIYNRFKIFCSFYYVAFEVVIPAEDSLIIDMITLPNGNLSIFGNMTPEFKIPSAVILNQSKEEGTMCAVIVQFCQLYSI